MPVEPVSPDEVTDAKLDGMPDEVIEAFNELIAKKWNGYEARVKQQEAIDLILEKMGLTHTPATGYWLEIEDLYRAKGWGVEYDKPAYNESYPAVFIFKKIPRETDV